MSSYAHLTANATTILSPSPVKIKGVVINSKGATANTLTLYDNASAASGNVIAVIDTTSAIGDIQYYNLNTTKGLVALVATGTAGDVTVVWE